MAPLRNFRIWFRDWLFSDDRVEKSYPGASRMEEHLSGQPAFVAYHVSGGFVLVASRCDNAIPSTGYNLNNQHTPPKAQFCASPEAITEAILSLTAAARLTK